MICKCDEKVFIRRACMKHLRERFDTDMKKLKWLQVKNSIKKGHGSFPPCPS